jgi:acetyltransferase-like isoleucine patch superfamily enzyme
VLINPALKSTLAAHGVATEMPGSFHLPDESVFEPPLSLKRMQCAYALEMGAFSFAESGYYFGVKIGRYCSIGRDVQIGRGSHPIDWGSSSPLFYQPHHTVFDQQLAMAANYQLDPLRPQLQAKFTTIGNDVRIGDGALISQGVTIQDGAVIEAGAVVTKDVPHYAIVAGNPGVIVGMRLPLLLAARMLHLAWWRFAFWDLSGAPVAQPAKFLDMVKQRIDEGLQPYAPQRIRLGELAASLPPTPAPIA